MVRDIQFILMVQLLYISHGNDQTKETSLKYIEIEYIKHK